MGMMKIQRNSSIPDTLTTENIIWREVSGVDRAAAMAMSLSEFIVSISGITYWIRPLQGRSTKVMVFSHLAILVIVSRIN